MCKLVTTIRHQFTHLTWHITGFAARCDCNKQLSENQRWIEATEIEDYAFPVPYLRLYQAFLSKGKS